MRCNTCHQFNPHGPLGVPCGRDLTEEINNELDISLPKSYVICPGKYEDYMPEAEPWTEESILEAISIENVGFQFHEVEGDSTIYVVIPLDDRSDPENWVLRNPEQHAWLIKRSKVSEAHAKRRAAKGDL